MHSRRWFSLCRYFRSSSPSQLRPEYLRSTELCVRPPLGFWPQCVETPRFASRRATVIAELVGGQLVPDRVGMGPQIVADPVPRAGLTLVGYRVRVEPYAIILAVATLILIMACRIASRHVAANLIAVAMGALLVKFWHFPVRTIESLFASDLRSFHLHPA